MDSEEKLEQLRHTRIKNEERFEKDYSYLVDYPEFGKYKALSTFSSEHRHCKEGEIYTAYDCGGNCIKFVFENGEMNFTKELFIRTMDAWKDVLEKVS